MIKQKPRPTDQEPGITLDMLIKNGQLVQAYSLRVNGQEIVLFGPILGWPDKQDTEIDELTFGELVNVDQVIETLQLMKNPEEREKRLGKLQ